jgi:hypothetical protein
LSSHPGEEITCDYDLFEWDARDKGISKCECGAPNCRGAALGFKFLPFDLQCEMIGNATAECVLEVGKPHRLRHTLLVY